MIKTYGTRQLFEDDGDCPLVVVLKSEHDAAISETKSNCVEQVMFMNKQIADLSRKLEIAKEHMNHSDNCEIHHGHRPCDCGLRQALKEME